MTKAYYRTRCDVDLDANPLAAALPFRWDPRNRASPLEGGSRDASMAGTFTDPQLAADGVVALVDAVETSLLDSYRPRNPFGDDRAELHENAFSSAPITLLTWEMGGDQQAAALLDHVLQHLPPVIDHEEFHGRPFRSRQLVSMSVEIQPFDLVRGMCAQVLKATDKSFGTTFASRVSRHASLTASAIAAVHACRVTHLGLLCLRVPLPLSHREAASVWELSKFLQMRCGMALFLCCSAETARRMGRGGRPCQKLRAAKLFGLTRVDHQP